MADDTASKPRLPRAAASGDHGGRIALVRPSFGLTGNELVEVLDGLAEGDIVLAAPGVVATLPLDRRWVAQ